jgi:predicted ribosome quality control (RQC) complex YloA/Tae2 family protein
MAFDGMFLRQVCRQLQGLNGARINKIYQISDTEVLFILKDTQRRQLMISCHSSYNRIHLTDRAYPTRSVPSSFIMVLRKHLEGGTVLSIEQAGLDRYLIITVGSRSEIGDRIRLQLYVELMGKYANLILVYDGKILEALKHIPPFENTRRTVQPGARFKPTEPQTDKLDPFTVSDVKPQDNLFETLIGFSPLLSKEFNYRMACGQRYQDILQELAASDRIYLYDTGRETLFHCLPLTHLEMTPRVMGICEGLDEIYYAREEKERIRQQTGDLFKFTRREIKKFEAKQQRLETLLQEALDCDKWRVYGDALYANADAPVKGKTHIVLTDYSGNTVDVPLDPKLDAKGNARKCFQKYRKEATGQKYLKEQLEQTAEMLAYFQQIQMQLEQGDFDTASEIRSELEENGLLKARRLPAGRKKKPSAPHFTRIPFGEHTIYLGRNNLQNEYVTFKKASRGDMWFHVKDMHGAHVVIDTGDPSEAEIRLCAMLAAYYSKARASSSIPVNYTLVKNLKKIPASKTGLVAMKEYRTIYIDIDLERLRPYLPK